MTLTFHQKWSLDKLKEEFSSDWFTLDRCYCLPIRRTRFTLTLLHEKGYLLEERNPDANRVLGDDLYRYKIVRDE